AEEAEHPRLQAAVDADRVAAQGLPLAVLQTVGVHGRRTGTGAGEQLSQHLLPLLRRAANPVVRGGGGPPRQRRPPGPPRGPAGWGRVRGCVLVDCAEGPMADEHRVSPAWRGPDPAGPAAPAPCSCPASTWPSARGVAVG